MAGTADAVDTAIGRVPTPGALDTTGLDIDEGTLDQLLTVDNEAWRGEIPLIDEHFKFIGERLPSEMSDELRELEKRLTD